MFQKNHSFGQNYFEKAFRVDSNPLLPLSPAKNIIMTIINCFRCFLWRFQLTEGDELGSPGKLLKECPCSALTLCTVNYKYLMMRPTIMTKLINSKHGDSIPFPCATRMTVRGMQEN